MGTGTGHDRLAQAWQDFVELPFPGHPDDPDLSDWVLDLAELDAHVAGLARSALSGGPVTAPPVGDIEQSARRLAALRVVGEDEEIYRQCQEYIESLAKVADALAESSA